jgi:hypothetical protein
LTRRVQEEIELTEWQGGSGRPDVGELQRARRIGQTRCGRATKSKRNLAKCVETIPNHLSKIPLPSPDDALAPAAANSRWGSNGYSANSSKLNGDELPDLLQQSRSDATAPKKRSKVDRPSGNGTGLSSLETDCLQFKPLPSEKEMMTSSSCTETSNEFDLSRRETIQETESYKIWVRSIWSSC